MTMTGMAQGVGHPGFLYANFILGIKPKGGKVYTCTLFSHIYKFCLPYTCKTTIMIRTKSKLISLVLVCFFLPLGILAQTTHTIVLEVNTTDITRATIPENASFVDQPDGVSNEDFTIVVSAGDTVIWEGISTSNSEDIVNITSINYEGGDRVFDRNRLRGDNGTPERVTGVITEGRRGRENKYKLSFKMSNHNGTFHIDPKIVVE